MKMHASDRILVRLLEAGQAGSTLALHELNLNGVSQTAASARLRELKRDMMVVSWPVEGKKYTAWSLTEAGKRKAEALVESVISSIQVVHEEPTLQV